MSNSPAQPDQPIHSSEVGFSQKLSNQLSTLTSGSILVVVGFLTGVVVLLVDYFPFTSDEFKDLIKLPAFQLFLFAIVAQTVFWTVAFGSMLPGWRLLWKNAKGHLPEIVAWSLLFAALVFSSRFFAFSCDNYALRHHGLKTSLLTYIGGVVAMMAAVGSILINIGLREILVKSAQSAEHGKEDNIENRQTADVEMQHAYLVRRYLFLRGSLLHFLSVLGIMLGLVVLAQGAKRYFIQNVANDCAPGFTRDKVLVFGLYYTLILILTFLPTFSLLIATGHKLRDDLLPIPSPHSDKWEDRCKRREKLDDLLALSMTERLRAIIAVSAPILGALISLLQFIQAKLGLIIHSGIIAP